MLAIALVQCTTTILFVVNFHLGDRSHKVYPNFQAFMLLYILPNTVLNTLGITQRGQYPRYPSPAPL